MQIHIPPDWTGDYCFKKCFSVTLFPSFSPSMVKYCLGTRLASQHSSPSRKLHKNLESNLDSDKDALEVLEDLSGFLGKNTSSEGGTLEAK